MLRVPLLGAGPIFPVPPHAPLVPAARSALPRASGLLAGFGSGLLTALVYGCEDLFQKLPIHWMWWPAIGALVVGIGGLIDPRVLGVGYDTIHGLLRGETDRRRVLGLLIGKGAGLGDRARLRHFRRRAGAAADHGRRAGRVGRRTGFRSGDAGLWAMVGMAAMMGGTMRSPLTAHGFRAGADARFQCCSRRCWSAASRRLRVTVLLMRRSILTEKLARRGHHITREYSVDPFELARVGDVMDHEVPLRVRRPCP